MYKWKICGITLKGKKHLKNNKECQDKIYSMKTKGFFAISLADGAGSCDKSDIGAEIVTKKSVKYIIKNFDKLIQTKEENISKNIIDYLKKILKKKASELNIKEKSLSSTLLFVVSRSDKAIIGHIGDGLIGVIDNEKNLDVLSYPDNGEYINSTFFVTSDNADKYLKIKKIENLKNIESFFIMSDGTAESFYNRKEKKFANSIKIIYKWLLENKEKDVQNALIDNFQDKVLNKTEDDCSFNLMVKQKSNNIELILKDNYELNKLFKTKNKKVIEKMTFVLNEINSGISSVKLISQNTKIPIRTIQRYIKRMKEINIIQ